MFLINLWSFWIFINLFGLFLVVWIFISIIFKDSKDFWVLLSFF